MNTTTTHRIRWYGIDPTTGERIPRNRHMNGGDWPWEAACSCGWETRTGGAIQERIREDIAMHRLLEGPAMTTTTERTVTTEWGDAQVTETPSGTRPDGVTLYDFTVTFQGEEASTGLSAGPVDDLVVRDIARHVVWRATGELPPLTR